MGCEPCRPSHSRRADLRATSPDRAKPCSLMPGKIAGLSTTYVASLTIFPSTSSILPQRVYRILGLDLINVVGVTRLQPKLWIGTDVSGSEMLPPSETPGTGPTKESLNESVFYRCEDETLRRAEFLLGNNALLPTRSRVQELAGEYHADNQ
jgi:hypothetical protein